MKSDTNSACLSSSWPSKLSKQGLVVNDHPRVSKLSLTCHPVGHSFRCGESLLLWVFFKHLIAIPEGEPEMWRKMTLLVLPSNSCHGSLSSSDLSLLCDHRGCHGPLMAALNIELEIPMPLWDQETVSYPHSLPPEHFNGGNVLCITHLEEEKIPSVT